MATLDHQQNLLSDLWLDQPDAAARIDLRRNAGVITELEAERLRTFSEQGYLRLSLGEPESLFRDFENDIQRIWRERPANVAVSSKGGWLTAFSDSDLQGPEEGYRIADFHSFSEAAKQLYVHPQIFRYVELILEDAAVAFQSLYFGYGSEQSLHRDPMFVVTRPPSHLVAAWIALEDIGPDCGPLAYVPGSHRLPWFEFGPDTIVVNKSIVSKEQREEFARWVEKTCAARGLQTQTFSAKRGDVFIWHAGLLHGGSRITRPGATRRSFVIHYARRDAYPERRANMRRRLDGRLSNVSGRTTQLIHNNGYVGLHGAFVSPTPDPVTAPWWSRVPDELSRRLGLPPSRRVQRLVQRVFGRLSALREGRR